MRTITKSVLNANENRLKLPGRYRRHTPKKERYGQMKKMSARSDNSRIEFFGFNLGVRGGQLGTK